MCNNGERPRWVQNKSPFPFLSTCLLAVPSLAQFINHLRNYDFIFKHFPLFFFQLRIFIRKLFAASGVLAR